MNEWHLQQILLSSLLDVLLEYAPVSSYPACGTIPFGVKMTTRAKVLGSAACQKIERFHLHNEYGINFQPLLTDIF